MSSKFFFGCWLPKIMLLASMIVYGASEIVAASGKGASSYDDGFIVDDEQFVSSSPAVSGSEKASSCRLTVSVSWDGTGDPTANVRRGPGKSYEKSGAVAEGEAFNVLKIEKNGENLSFAGKSDTTWYQILTPNGNAWLWGGYANANCGSSDTSGGSNSGFIVDNSTGESRTGSADSGDNSGFIIDDEFSNSDFIIPGGDSSSNGGFIVDTGGDSGFRAGNAVSGCRLTVYVSWDGTGDPTANLRSGPGTTYAKVGQVREGESYTVISVDHNGQNFSIKGKSDSTWYQIDGPSGKAWLWAGFTNSTCGGDSSSTGGGDVSGGGFIIDAGSSSDDNSDFILDDGEDSGARSGTSDGFIVPENSSNHSGGSQNESCAQVCRSNAKWVLDCIDLNGDVNRNQCQEWCYADSGCRE